MFLMREPELNKKYCRAIRIKGKFNMCQIVQCNPTLIHWLLVMIEYGNEYTNGNLPKLFC